MENNKISKAKPVSQLQLDSPRLPSARRSVSSVDTNTNQPNLTRDDSLSKICMMVPFSWESSPGVPKVLSQRDPFSDKELDHVPPKLPPCRWHPSKGGVNNDCDHELSEGSSDYGDAFSDAFDRVSLTEQLGIAGRLSSFRGLGLKDKEELRNQSPSFIMDRFLPAANAIASSSVVKTPKRRAQKNKPIKGELPIPQTNNDMAQMVPLSQNVEIHKEMSSRACGLMVFFPWKMKPIVCGFNNLANKNRMPHPNTSMLPRNNNHREVNDFGLFDKKPSYRERLSQGLGLSFLDTSRLPSMKTLNKLRQRNVEGQCTGDREKKNGNKMVYFAQNNSLPELKPPEESWLSHTLGSTNKGS
ncbi:hypothetical protein LUZ63_018069 [Rhynchospora breviuscula]|uniref:Uncharacterized protein n=1 Tax=Rhynchospora breviuscula TaxID=2022672 RepID=A0A9Q0C3N9_9POAL|nr:hypothetical protein LUZ63_018069 [Rhynchospora breviuscula]